jgi:hypothetical protein
MLQRFRQRARAVALALLVALVALGGVSVHGAECHDADAAVAAHDASAHRLDAPRSESGHPLHCILCHWARTPRPSAERSHHVEQPLPETVAVLADAEPVPASISVAFQPLRSPPVRHR